jgi:pimeloyl-ACP methyl ester carboxylesterase
VDRARSAIVWVNEAGKEADGMEFGVLERFARQGHVAVAVDVRGVGGTRPPHTSPDYGAGPFNHLFSVETAASYMAWFMDESLFGMRVRDVRRAVDYALSRTDVDRSGVRMVGKGAGALWSLYAAALDERIRSLVAEGGLVTYAGLTQGDRYLEGAGIFVRDVLLRFDLPHVAGAVADRNLVLVAPVDPMKRALDRAAAANAYQWALETYRHAGAADRFRIAGRGANADPAEAYLALL